MALLYFLSPIAYNHGQKVNFCVVFNTYSHILPLMVVLQIFKLLLDCSIVRLWKVFNMKVYHLLTLFRVQDNFNKKHFFSFVHRIDVQSPNYSIITILRTSYYIQTFSVCLSCNSTFKEHFSPWVKIFWCYL